jgi:hypothetical protein
MVIVKVVSSLVMREKNILDRTIVVVTTPELAVIISRIGISSIFLAL